LFYELDFVEPASDCRLNPVLERTAARDAGRFARRAAAALKLIAAHEGVARGAGETTPQERGQAKRFCRQCAKEDPSISKPAAGERSGKGDKEKPGDHGTYFRPSRGERCGETDRRVPEVKRSGEVGHQRIRRARAIVSYLHTHAIREIVHLIKNVNLQRAAAPEFGIKSVLAEIHWRRRFKVNVFHWFIKVQSRIGLVSEYAPGRNKGSQNFFVIHGGEFITAARRMVLHRPVKDLSRLRSGHSCIKQP
jgi:hypothetical protein